jgi:hypothetical protein
MKHALGCLATVVASIIGLFISFAMLALGAANGSGRIDVFTYILCGLFLVAYAVSIYRAVSCVKRGDLFASASSMLLPPFLTFALVIAGSIVIAVFKFIFK